jgi:vacuolar protein sorting-associated protein 11
VLLYRHLDQYLFSGSNSLSALPKAKTVHESPTEPVTGLGFREPLLSSSDKAERENLHLFIVTTNRVLSYLAAGKGSGAPPVVVNEVGCGLGCATMDHRTREMAIARDEAIYMCKPDGLGACYAIECDVFST